MNDAPSPTVDRVISCVIAVGVLCLTLLIVGAILISVGT